MDSAEAKRAIPLWFTPTELVPIVQASAGGPLSQACSETGTGEEGAGDEGKSKGQLKKDAKKAEKAAKKDGNKKTSAGIPAEVPEGPKVRLRRLLSLLSIAKRCPLLTPLLLLPPTCLPQISLEPPSGTRDFFPDEVREL